MDTVSKSILLVFDHEPHANLHQICFSMQQTREIPIDSHNSWQQKEGNE